MKIKIGTILLILIISLSALMGFRQYQRDESAKKSTESEPQTEISWNTPYGKATMKKVADLDEIESESYDVTRSFYKDYDDTGLETCMLTGIFADSEEAAIKQVRETGYCRYAYLTEDGKCEIKLTETQKLLWIDAAKKSIQEILEDANQLDGCIFEVNDDYTDLSVQISKEKVSPDYFFTQVIQVIYCEEIIQLFSGKDEWSVHFIVKNINTGYELVNVNYPQEEWEISGETWDE